jgi:sporulation protein YlmC with PRC-barrel domain
MTRQSMLKYCATISTAALLLAAAPAFAQTQTAAPPSGVTQSATPPSGADQTAVPPSSVDKPAAVSPAPRAEAPATTDVTTADAATAKPGFIAEQGKDQWLASKNLIGAKVAGPTNETVGSINDLVIERDGKVTAAVIGVGGFLGIGQKNVAVPYKSLELARDGDNNDKIAMRFTKDELKQAPDFKPLEAVPPKTATGTPGAVRPGTGMAGPGGPGEPRH